MEDLVAGTGPTNVVEDNMKERSRKRPVGIILATIAGIAWMVAVVSYSRRWGSRTGELFLLISIAIIFGMKMVQYWARLGRKESKPSTESTADARK